MSKKSSIEHVRSMVICAMLIALSVVLTRFASPQMGDAVRFSFGTIPIMLAGILCGPVYGFIVGALADFIGYLVNPMGGGFAVGLTLCSALLGAVPAIMCNYVFKSKQNTLTLGISVFVSELVVSGVFKSLFLMILYGGTYLTWLGPKLLNAVVMAVLELIVLEVLLKALNKVLK